MWQEKANKVRRAIENRGFTVFDANVLFRANCANIDLVVFGKTKAIYVQVDCAATHKLQDKVALDGSPWTAARLYDDAPIYNRQSEPSDFKASLIVIVDHDKSGEDSFYIAPPKDIEKLIRQPRIEWASRSKRDKTRRSIESRIEVPKSDFKPWLEAWYLFD
jgi:hypothetical protein